MAGAIGAIIARRHNKIFKAMTENEISTAITAVNKWLFHGWNYETIPQRNHGKLVYVPRFLVEVEWNCNFDHMLEKWNLATKAGNSDAYMASLYKELDSENRSRLIAWVMENYDDEQRIGAVKTERELWLYTGVFAAYNDCNIETRMFDSKEGAFDSWRELVDAYRRMEEQNGWECDDYTEDENYAHYRCSYHDDSSDDFAEFQITRHTI